MSKLKYRIGMTLSTILILVGCAIAGKGIKGKIDENRLKKIQEHANDIVSDVINATVFLRNCPSDPEARCSTGTGFVVSTDPQGSFIVTNKHVCLRAALSSEEVIAQDNLFRFRRVGILARFKEPSLGQIVKVGVNSDLCLIRSDLKFTKALPLAPAVTPKEDIMTFGYPGSNPELNLGKYLRTELEGLGFYSVTDIRIWYGASGSAAVNTKGEVIGVMSNIRFKDEAWYKEKKERDDVKESLFVPLEILREFLGGI